MQGRFGHTLTFVSENKMVVFGGAIDSKDQAFVTTNDTFLVNCDTLAWQRLESKLNRHQRRAVPAGGALNGGG